MPRLLLRLLPLIMVMLTAVLTDPLPAAQQDVPEQPNDEPAETGKLEKLTLTLDAGGHTLTIRRVLFTPDSKHLITGSDDHSIRVWDVVTGDQLRVLHPPGVGSLNRLALSPDGKTLAVASAYPAGDKLLHVIYLMTLVDGRLERVLKGHTEYILGVAFSHDGKRLASSAEDRSIRIWDPVNGQTVQVLPTKLTPTKATHAREPGKGQVAFSPEGDRLAYLHGACRVIELSTGNVGASLPNPKNFPFNGLAWSPDGKTIATSGRAGGFQLWDPAGKSRLQPRAEKSTHAVAFSKDSRHVLATWDANPYVRATLFDAATGKEVVTFAPKKPTQPNLHGLPPDYPHDSALSPDGQLAATAAGEFIHEVLLWKTADGSLGHCLTARSWLGGRMEAGWSADGKAVAWTRLRNKARYLFHLGELELRPAPADLQVHGPTRKEGPLTLERLDRNKRYSSVQVVKDGKEVGDLKLLRWSHKPMCYTFVGPGQAAVAGIGGGFFLYNIATGKQIREFRGYTQIIISSAASPDKARYLATLGRDQTLRIWDPNRDLPLLSLFVHGEDWIIWTPLGYYAATPGGERLIGWIVDNGIDHMPAFYPAQRFRKQLYRPDVIKLILDKGSVEEALKTANAALGLKTSSANLKQLLPPTIRLTVDKTNPARVKVKATATAAVKQQPVTSLRLLLDGRPLPAKETLCELGAGKDKETVEWTVAIPEGTHHLGVLARCPDASSVSESVTIVNTPAAKLPTLHVLTIGINRYHEKALNLDFAKPDAQALATAFQKHGKGALFGDVRAASLLDSQARRQGVLDAIQAVRKTAKENDLFVVFFAGHGVKDKEQFYFLTVEAQVDRLAQTALSGTDLRKALGEFPCQVLLMLDACHSAGFGQGRKLTQSGLRPATDDATRALTDDDIGVAVMCAAMGHEKAQEKDGHGLFTKAVLEALELAPGVPRHPFNQKMYVHHLQTYVFDQVSHRSGERQHPFLSLPWVVESFPVR